MPIKVSSVILSLDKDVSCADGILSSGRLSTGTDTSDGVAGFTDSTAAALLLTGISLSNSSAGTSAGISMSDTSTSGVVFMVSSFFTASTGFSSFFDVLTSSQAFLDSESAFLCIVIVFSCNTDFVSDAANDFSIFASLSSALAI